mgnify:CR=1 FL=1|tara:strand:+ start:22887 stop:23345 length:459 start_codon:yes stop_codon:yes gene_type:complete
MDYTLNKKGNIITKKPIKTFKNMAFEQQQIMDTSLVKLDKLEIKLTEIKEQQDKIAKYLENNDLIGSIFSKSSPDIIEYEDIKKINESDFVNNLSRKNLKTLKDVQNETGFSAYLIRQEVQKGNLKRVAMSGKWYFLDRDIENWKSNLINKK